MLSRDNLTTDSEQPFIHESIRIEDFLDHIQAENFLGIFDIDNTLIQSSEDLGSDQWFMKLMDYAYQAAPSKETESLVIAIYHALHQYHTKIQAVEAVTVPMIKNLQDKNTPLIGLTARGKEIKEATISQLNSIGIEFKLDKVKQMTIGLTVNGIENAAIYQNGVIFCSGFNKGECLQAFFDAILWQPAKVVMVDDKRKHLKAIKETISLRGSQFQGIRYGYLDAKVEDFQKSMDAMYKANIQLLDAYHKFPENAKLAIQKIFLFEPRSKKEADAKKETQTYGLWF